jgi:hypothetical protein
MLLVYDWKVTKYGFNHGQIYNKCVCVKKDTSKKSRVRFEKSQGVPPYFGRMSKRHIVRGTPMTSSVR